MTASDGPILTILLTRKAGLTFEEFQIETKKHIEMAAPIFMKHGVIYYHVQFNSPANRASCKELFSVDLGIDINEETSKDAFVEYDAVTTIKFAGMDGLKGFLGCEEKRKKLDGDGQRFASAAKIAMGTGFLAIEGGVLQI